MMRVMLGNGERMLESSKSSWVLFHISLAWAQAEFCLLKMYLQLYQKRKLNKTSVL